MRQTLHYRIKLLIIDIIVLFSHIQLLTKESNMMTLLAQHTTYTYTQCITNYLRYFREMRKAKDLATSQFLSLISLKVLVAYLVHLNSLS